MPNASNEVLLPVTHHWSASRFMLFQECPWKFEQRYIHGVASEPSLAMLFGHTVHTALETLLQGHRGVCPIAAEPHQDHLDCARSRYWQEFDLMRSALAVDGVEADGLLYLEGLRMIDQVDALKLQDGRATPERWFSIPTGWGQLDWPVVGAVDLWCPPWSRHGPVIWDFKTTVGAWSQTRAEKERWQPLLYSWAYVRAFDVVPTFRYLVLNRMTGAVDVFDRRWQSRREWSDDLDALEFECEEIAEAVAIGDYDCSCRHGNCLECGEAYGHDHVCRTPARPKVHLSGAR